MILIILLKSNETIKYDIAKDKTPKMPNLEKRTECIQILRS